MHKYRCLPPSSRVRLKANAAVCRFAAAGRKRLHLHLKSTMLEVLHEKQPEGGNWPAYAWKLQGGIAGFRHSLRKQAKKIRGFSGHFDRGRVDGGDSARFEKFARAGAFFCRRHRLADLWGSAYRLYRLQPIPGVRDSVAAGLVLHLSVYRNHYCRTYHYVSGSVFRCLVFWRAQPGRGMVMGVLA